MNPKFFKIYREKDIMAATKLSRATISNWKRGVKNATLDKFYQDHLHEVELLIDLKKQGFSLNELNKTRSKKITRYQYSYL